MIVKAQVNISGTAGALIYNKSRTIEFQSHNLKLVGYVQKCLHPDVKGFFRAKVIGRNIKLMARVSDRDW